MGEKQIILSNGIGYDALKLAMSRTIGEETAIKQQYTEQGIRHVVTEVGGKSSLDFQGKMGRSVLGASLNAGVIEKTPHEIHALVHACEEAKRGLLINSSSEVNLAVKVAIVRKDHWIAIAIFGDSAIHPYSSHERCGLGIMNI